MSRILVTGGAGLLGSHLLPLLDGEVYAAGRVSPSAAASTVTLVPLNLSRPIDRSVLPEQIDTVIHLAQSNRYREFPEAADDVFQVNTAQLVGLLDYARMSGAKRFVYASTGSVYAASRDPLREEDALVDRDPAGFYPATKLAGEILARSYSSLMSVSILRFFFVYGRGQKEDMLVPRLVRSVATGTPITLQGDGGFRSNPVHASDAARAVAASLALEGHNTINVAGPQVLSLRDMGEAIGARAGKPPVFAAGSDQPAPVLVADTSRMERLLITPSVRFADGIADFVHG